MTTMILAMALVVVTLLWFRIAYCLYVAHKANVDALQMVENITATLKEIKP